jgi:hypothetical protein
LRIGEPKHAKSFSVEESIAAHVGALTFDEIVTLAIKLNDQFRGVTSEVGNVVSDRDLAPKAQAVNSMCADVAPEQCFSACRRLAKLLRPTALDCADS